MSVLSEGALRITVPPDARSARRFDGEEHRLSHCMKAVDFIIEFADYYLFIEVKDPDQSPRPSAYAEFTERFERGKMYDSLKYKYRDSFLYEWAAGRADKPVDYLVLVALESLDPAQLMARGDELQRVMPTGLPRDTAWKRPIVRKCGVFNIASWNESFPDFRVERVAARPSDPPSAEDQEARADRSRRRSPEPGQRGA